VLIATFSRRRFLPLALASVLRQSYENLQVIVVNDGGEDVTDIINSFGDRRVVFINRKENYGKACSLNQALERAQGKYVAYIDDDDLYYPGHIETLVNVLENSDRCGAAYSDLYNVACRVLPDGSRRVLSKVVDVSRDFDRFFMLYFNHVLHVSLMHRRDLIERTGPYNEELNILIDWDMTRRLAFFTDFQHVCEITGEFYSPVGDCDRISIQRRKDRKEYHRNLLTIRTTRPAKPWPKIGDMSIIFTTEKFDRRAGKTLGLIWQHTFYPYQVYLPLPRADMGRLDTDMPNIIPVAVDSACTGCRQIDAALAKCEGEYIAVVPSGFAVRELWLEDSLHGLINSSVDREAFELEGSTQDCWAMVARKDDLEYARAGFGHLPLRRCLEAAGIAIKRVLPEQILFQFDQLLGQAKAAENDGKWAFAAEIYEYIADNYGNELWTRTLAARAFFRAGDCPRSAEISRQINQLRPTVETLLLEARVRRRQENPDLAIELLRKAERMLREPLCEYETPSFCYQDGL